MLFNNSYSYDDEISTQSKSMDSSFNWLFFLAGSLLVSLLTYCVYKRIMRNNIEILQDIADEQQPGSPRIYHAV